MNKKLNEAVAKLHLEEGDALVIDARVFTRPQDMTFSDGVARNCRIFAVLPNVGETVADAFTAIHARQMDEMTKERLLLAMRMYFPAGGRSGSLIDGIEKDFCKCYLGADVGDNNEFATVKSECAIHERCAVLRTLIPTPEEAPTNATD